MQPYPPRQPQLYRQPPQQRSEPGGIGSLILSGVLLVVAAGCFIYVVITWLNDQNTPLQLAVDSLNIVKFSAFGILAFFLSYLCLFIALVTRFYSS